MKFGRLILRKIIQIVATKCHILRLKMHQIPSLGKHMVIIDNQQESAHAQSDGHVIDDVT